jgi:hypothetical protein
MQRTCVGRSGITILPSICMRPAWPRARGNRGDCELAGATCAKTRGYLSRRRPDNSVAAERLRVCAHVLVKAQGMGPAEMARTLKIGRASVLSKTRRAIGVSDGFQLCAAYSLDLLAGHIKRDGWVLPGMPIPFGGELCPVQDCAALTAAKRLHLSHAG